MVESDAEAPMNDDDGGFAFLPDVDDKLFADFDFETPSVPTLDTPGIPLTTLPVPKPRRNKVAIEILSLQHEEVELELQLDNLERERSAARSDLVSTGAATWEQAARTQLALKRKALRENSELRAMLAEQTQWQQQLDGLVCKKPRMMMMRLDETQWRVLKLSAHGEKRLAAIHAIADRQFDVVDNEMLASGLVGVASEVATFRENDRDATSSSVEAIRSTWLPNTTPFAATAAMWQALQFMQAQAKAMFVPHQSCTYTIDADTIFMRSHYLVNATTSAKVETGIVMKKRMFDGGRRVRIVWRTVLDDELMPFAHDSVVSDHHGWVEFDTTMEGPVQMKAFYQLKVAQEDQVDQLSDAMRVIHFRDALPSSPALSQRQVVRVAFEDGFRTLEKTFRQFLVGH
ncbi:Aste57867_3186 [Aphanomyces stellatus]|uniref:Aste57867_3186 protein n=1 Tax=Aphanomyces stellatus TaxID=120398 RepID=A0A485KEY1_9STRA|nr:hypothetical protein As57867_003177 [Aphanomyces stellatus]VFT80360.1 Aste57867_3186 [Aphanomyces stellatus]